jgi:hypothetical protein
MNRSLQDPLLAIVPGLPDGFVDSLREAATYDEFDRAQNLMAALGRLIQARQTDRMHVRLTITIAVLAPLDGEERKRAEAFLERLSWPR